MKFDVQTYSRALATASLLASGKPVLSLNEEDYAYQLKSNAVLITCRHLTTSPDCCADISKFGLTGWKAALSFDSRLKRVFDGLGIGCTSNGQLERNGQSFESCCYQNPSRALELDNCISAYLYCGDPNEGYCRSPEILRTLKDKAFPCVQTISEAEEKWRKSSKPYCVSFDVSLSDVDVITRYYSTEEGGDIEYALSCVLLDVLRAKTSGHSYVLQRQIALKHGVIIPPGQLSINELADLDWDWSDSGKDDAR